MSTRFGKLTRRGPNSNFLEFEISGLDLAVVNAMRRTIIADVPTAAFCFSSEPHANTIVINKNTSVLHNEFLGHRISLVPIFLTEDETHAVAEGTLDLTFRLQVKNETQAPLDVTSGDIRGTRGGQEIPREELLRLFPANALTGDHVLIMKLRHGSGLADLDNAEEVDMVMRLRMGRGRDHARWMPTSLCTLAFRVDEAKADAALEAEVQEATRNNATPEEIQRIRHDFQCTGRHRHFVVNEHGEPSEFTFKIRSECGLRSEYIVFKALVILSEELKSFSKSILDASEERAADTKVTVEPMEGIDGMVHLTVRDADHTLGNLVQALLYNRFIRSPTPKEDSLEYVGYHQPHPLENVIVLRCKVRLNNPDGTPGENRAKINAFLSECVAEIAHDMEVLAAEWHSASDLEALGISEVNAWIKSIPEPRLNLAIPEPRLNLAIPDSPSEEKSLARV
jgi:DNA-directed RNA polymerase alpha subunit/DNA-directed RNA polymerase subunit L